VLHWRWTRKRGKERGESNLISLLREGKGRGEFHAAWHSTCYILAPVSRTILGTPERGIGYMLFRELLLWQVGLITDSQCYYTMTHAFIWFLSHVNIHPTRHTRSHTRCHTEQENSACSSFIYLHWFYTHPPPFNPISFAARWEKKISEQGEERSSPPLVLAPTRTAFRTRSSISQFYFLVSDLFLNPTLPYPTLEWRNPSLSDQIYSIFFFLYSIGFSLLSSRHLVSTMFFLYRKQTGSNFFNKRFCIYGLLYLNLVSLSLPV
jgi:hypothetical protein